MKPNVPATLLATLVAGLAAASGQTPTNFASGITVGSPQAATFDSFVTGTSQMGAEIFAPNAGLLLYSGVSETARGNLDGGITLQGKPLRMVIGADNDLVSPDSGTFEVWRMSQAWGGPSNLPLFSIDSGASTGNFNGLNVTITNGTLSVGGSPVLTAATAGATYITAAQANTNYPLKTALPLFGTEGTNFDRANGSATFGDGSYALGINNFATGAARVGKDNGLNWRATPGIPNATTPIPYTNFKNNAAFGSSIVGHGPIIWAAGDFRGTEKLENNLSAGSSRLSVSGGGQIFNSVSTGSSLLYITPGTYLSSPQDGVSLFGDAEVYAYGNANVSYTTVTGSSRIALRQDTSSTTGTNEGTAKNTTVLGASSLAMLNSSTSATPNSDHVTLSGNSRSAALNNRSNTYSTAVGRSMIFSSNGTFTGTGTTTNPGDYFGATERWAGVTPRLDTTFGFAAGESVVANGSHGTALGKARVYADYGTAIGEGVDAGTAGASVTGRFNKLQQYTYASDQEGTMQQFVVGNGIGDADADRSNALVVERAGLTTLTNKSWKANVAVNPTQVLVDPPSPTNNDRGGDALAVEGHTRLKGKVLIRPQGDLSMGGFMAGEQP